jgi:hypothetical protein
MCVCFNSTRDHLADQLPSSKTPMTVTALIALNQIRVCWSHTQMLSQVQRNARVSSYVEHYNLKARELGNR